MEKRGGRQEAGVGGRVPERTVAVAEAVMVAAEAEMALAGEVWAAVVAMPEAVRRAAPVGRSVTKAGRTRSGRSTRCRRTRSRT